METDGKPIRNQPFVQVANHPLGITSGTKGYQGLTGRQEKVENKLPERMLRTEEAAEYLQLTPSTVRKYANAGTLKSRLVNGRRRYKMAWLKEYQDEGEELAISPEIVSQMMDEAKQMQEANKKEAERLAVIKGEMERAEAKLIRFCNEQGKELKDWLESDKGFEG